MWGELWGPRAADLSYTRILNVATLLHLHQFESRRGLLSGGIWAALLHWSCAGVADELIHFFSPVSCNSCRQVLSLIVFCASCEISAGVWCGPQAAEESHEELPELVSFFTHETPYWVSCEQWRPCRSRSPCWTSGLLSRFTGDKSVDVLRKMSFCFGKFGRTVVPSVEWWPVYCFPLRVLGRDSQVATSVL